MLFSSLFYRRGRGSIKKFINLPESSQEVTGLGSAARTVRFHSRSWPLSSLPWPLTKYVSSWKKKAPLVSSIRRRGPEHSHQALRLHSWIQSPYRTFVPSGMMRTFKHSGARSQGPQALLRPFSGWNLLSSFTPPFCHKSSILLLQDWAQKIKQK